MININFRLVGRFRWLFLALTMLISFSFASAQTKTISGIVSDEEGPLPGVSVTIKGGAVGAVSDFDGIYSIEAENGNVLVFSYQGYISVEKTVGDVDDINVKIVKDINDLETVVVVGYQKQKKIEVTGAISSITGEEVVKQSVATDPAEALQGRLAGVNVQASSGAPGSRANVQIRGANSLSGNGAGNESDPNAAIANPLTDGLQPLWVVDGVAVTGNPNLTASEIESLEVLKDGASASIYGIRAAAGVILVTTKRGKEGKLKVDFSSYTSLNRLTRRIPTLNASEAVANQLILNANQFFGGDIQNAFNAGGTVFSQNPSALNFDTNFQDEILQDNAITTNANLRFSGGVDFMNFSLNLDYLNQEGSIKNTGNERVNARLNTGFNKGKFSAYTNLFLSNSNVDLEPFRVLFDGFTTPSYIAGPDDVVGNVLFIDRRSANQIAGGSNFIVNKLRQSNKRQELRANASGSFAYKWFKGFTTKLNLSAGRFETQDRFFTPGFSIVDVETNEIPSNQVGQSLGELATRTGVGQNESVEFFTEYETNIGSHKITALAGASAEKRSFQFESATLRSFDTGVRSPQIDAAKDRQSVFAAGNLTKNNLGSLLGSLGYGYQEKYLIKGNVRRDTSSNFDSENRSDTFGGVSVGWVPSSENFFVNSDLLSFVQSLKFRASIGWVGNQNVPSFVSNPGLSTGATAVFGNQIVNGVALNQVANRNLRWETSVSKNLGVDLYLFNGAFNFTGELYRVEKEDLLFNTNLALSSGFGINFPGVTPQVFTNVGSLVNKGVELSAGYRDVKGDFRWNVSSAFTSNENTITRLSSDNSQINGGQPAPGTGQLGSSPVNFGVEQFPVGSFFLLDSDGIIKNQEELDQYKLLGGVITDNAQIGDLKFRDANNDGIIDIDSDRVFKGSSIPDFELGLNYGMSYKNFDFSMQWFASYGAKVYNGPRALSINAQNNRDLLFAFREGQTGNTTIPINREVGNPSNFLSITDQFLENGDYIRLRNIQVGYNFPEEVLKNLNVSKLRIYLAASNLLTITDYSGFDPEVGGDGLFSRGIDRGNTPVTGSGRIGLELSF